MYGNDYGASLCPNCHLAISLVSYSKRYYMAERFRGINLYQNFFQNSHVMWVEAQEVFSMLGDITLLCYFSR